MKNTELAEQQLNKIVDLFGSTKLVNTVKIAFIETYDRPSNHWSFRNQVLMVAQNTTDARNLKEWCKMGRRINKGAKAIYILSPRFAMIKQDCEIHNNKNCNICPKEKQLIGFGCMPEFRLEDTNGCPLPIYKPKNIPELMQVAKKWEMDIKYDLLPNAYGSFQQFKNRITLATEEPKVFYHELAHQADCKINNGLKNGQDPIQEAVAELSACVLESIYDKSEKSLAWSQEYIAHYAKSSKPQDIAKFCIKVLDRVKKVLDLIITTNEEIKKESDSNLMVSVA